MAASAPWVLSQVQVVAEAAATVAFALSGVIEGARKRLDAVGICVVGGLAAFGGGTIRDVLLDRRPLFWIEHAGWIWVLLALCIGAMVFMRAPPGADRACDAVARCVRPRPVHRQRHPDRAGRRHARRRRRIAPTRSALSPALG
jgi:uncharacterized membrane protein YedE/YeeE